MSLMRIKTPQFSVENKNLTDLLISLQVKNSDLKRDLTNTTHTNHEFTNLRTQIDSLTEENRHLREDLSLKDVKYNNIIIDIRTKYEAEISRLNFELDIVNNKFTFINRLESYVKSLEDLTEELKGKISKLEEDHKANLQVEFERNKLEVDELKQKTLNILKNAKRQANLNAHENMNISSKLTLLTNNHLKGELAAQSIVIEDMIQEDRKKIRKIMELEIDIDTQKEVGYSLSQHNKKLVEIIKDLSNTNKTLTASIENYRINKEKFNNTFKNINKDSCNCVCYCNKSIHHSISKTNDRAISITGTCTNFYSQSGTSFYKNLKTAADSNMYTTKNFKIPAEKNNTFNSNFERVPILENIKLSNKNKKSLRISDKAKFKIKNITILDEYVNEIKNGPIFI